MDGGKAVAAAAAEIAEEDDDDKEVRIREKEQKLFGGILTSLEKDDVGPAKKRIMEMIKNNKKNLKGKNAVTY